MNRNVAIAAAAFGGVLAGATLDRGLVGIPALYRLGPKTWADYSRNADLSVRGAAFYPTLAFGNTILSVATAITAPKNRAATVAATLAIAGLLLTLKAAPNMLRLRRLSDTDEPAIREAMHGFMLWSALRGACQVGAFAANLAALARDLR
jgi:hypothetical protein